LRIQVARSAGEMDRWRDVWHRLFADAPKATLFQSFCWNRLAAASFADRESPFAVLAESSSGIALIPASITVGGVSLIGETLFDYRDILWTGCEETLWAAWRRLAALRLPLSITGLREGEPWPLFGPSKFVHAPQVPCGAVTATEFAAKHSRLERTLRLLAKAGAELRRYDGTAGDLIAWLYGEKGKQASGSGENLFRDSRRRDFLVSACALDPKACELFTFEAGGRPIAALLTLRDRGVRRFYTVWFDSRWARFSPGTALVYAATADALSAGLDCDYMTGEQPFKMRFAMSLAPLYRLDLPAEGLANVVGAELAQAG
jgi:hypothetical protein